jgi:N-acetylmuramoyl-L-alanine amidase
MNVSSLFTMSLRRFKVTKYRWVIVIAALFSLGPVPPVCQKGMALSAAPRTIVLDPGHGGPDTGARGAAGAMEKNVTLALARQLADRLPAHYRVRLTRTGDYAVGLADRTAEANQINADLFISLHTGAGFRRHENHVDVWYLNMVSNRRPAAVSSDAPTVAWNEIQVRHIEASTRLAGKIKGRLAGLAQGPAPETGGAPLTVLQGADMPAVLIEVGYLTHPATEQRLSDPAHLRDLAARIARGIDDYFAAPDDPTDTITATDLKE